ncbi:TPA: ribosomal-protein-alanine N-acetyltransferase [bacterium]|nr:ribosomal-protein-alanine N-acetyltransferase [bacterium]
MAKDVSQLIIRPLKKGDIKEVAAIEEASFSDPWQDSTFYNELYHGDISKFLIAQMDKRVVGYIGMWFIGDEAHIVNIAVHPNYRRQGIGTKLVMALFDEIRKKGIERITLEVRASNIIAQQFYKKFDFQEIAIQEKYYRDTHEDALIMWKDRL